MTNDEERATQHTTSSRPPYVLTDEMRKQIAVERLRREDPGTDLILAELHASSNDRIRKMAMTYELGLLTFSELESFVRSEM